MTAHRAPVLLGLLLAACTGLGATADIDADPHELYETARARLAQGDLRETAAALSRLNALIASRPDWDPEGAFANELLPPLQSRLQRLQGASRRLEAFADHALENVKPPDISNEMSTVREYTHWATVVIQRLRAERDAIIDTALADAEEKAILTRTESYARTVRLLELEVLEKMAKVAGDDILGLLAGDPELESVLVRFRQLKQELMRSVSERDRLARGIEESDHRNQILLRTLADVVTDDTSLPVSSDGGKPPNVDERFTRVLDAERERLSQGSAPTPTERDRLRGSLERYRRSNRVLVAAGVISDQSARIEALAQDVAGLPETEEAPAASAWAGWSRTLLIAVLASCGALLAGIRLGRRRGDSAPLSSAALPLAPPRPRGVVVPIERPNVRTGTR